MFLFELLGPLATKILFLIHFGFDLSFVLL